MKYNDLASQLDWGRLVNYCNVIYAAHYVYIKLLIPVYIYIYTPIFTHFHAEGRSRHVTAVKACGGYVHFGGSKYQLGMLVAN